jgi:LysR family transcriptional regulator, regulator of abg operon
MMLRASEIVAEAPKMKLHHLQEVVAVAEQGSIRAAARHLGLAQPALTRSLAELERELGIALFERRSRGVVVTEIGKAFVFRAASIGQEMRRALEEVDQLRGISSGSVSAGLSIAAHLAYLPYALKHFRARYDRVMLHIIEGYYPTLEATLREGRLDFFIGPKPGLKIASELKMETIAENRRVVIARSGHPLAKATSLRQLSGAAWAASLTAVGAKDEIGPIFLEHRLPPPKLVVRSQSALTLLTCLSHSDLLALVPAQWSQFPLAPGLLTILPLKEEFDAPPIVAISRADLPLTPAATYLLDLIRRAAAHKKPVARLKSA